MEKGRWRPFLEASMNLRLRAYADWKATGGGPLFSVHRTAMQALVVAFLLSTARSAGVVDVDEVVLHAAIAERAHPAVVGDRVSVRFSPLGVENGAPFSLVRELGSVGANGSGDAVGLGGSRALARALASAGFDWKQPLSVQPFMMFRALHPLGNSDGARAGRMEHVVRLAKEGLLVVTATAVAAARASATATASEGRQPQGEPRPEELRGVELAVDAKTYQVVREAFVFANIGRLEIAELGYRVASYGPASVDSARVDSARDSARVDSTPNDSVANDSVRRDSARTASGREPGVAAIPAHPSRDELDLAELKRRLVRARTGADMRGGIPSSRLPEAATLGLRRWRYRTFGESATRRTFLPDLTRSLGNVRQRLEILTNLAEHYPAPRNHMSSATSAAFQQLVDLQYRRLRAELNDVKQRVSTLSGSVVVAVDTEDAPPYLVSRAAVMLSRARAVEQLVHESFGQEDLAPEDRQRINAAFGALWEAVYGPPGRSSRGGDSSGDEEYPGSSGKW